MRREANQGNDADNKRSRGLTGETTDGNKEEIRPKAGRADILQRLQALLDQEDEQAPGAGQPFNRVGPTSGSQPPCDSLDQTNNTNDGGAAEALFVQEAQARKAARLEKAAARDARNALNSAKIAAGHPSVKSVFHDDKGVESASVTLLAGDYLKETLDEFSDRFKTVAESPYSGLLLNDSAMKVFKKIHQPTVDHFKAVAKTTNDALKELEKATQEHPDKVLEWNADKNEWREQAESSKDGKGILYSTPDAKGGLLIDTKSIHMGGEALRYYPQEVLQEKGLGNKRDTSGYITIPSGQSSAKPLAGGKAKTEITPPVQRTLSQLPLRSTAPPQSIKPTAALAAMQNSQLRTTTLAPQTLGRGVRG
jgi:hypothetical protein